MSATTCRCKKAHVKKVRTSSISIFGAGVAWLAARPEGVYLAGHGYHFDNFPDALKYAIGDTDDPRTRPATARV